MINFIKNFSILLAIFIAFIAWGVLGLYIAEAILLNFTGLLTSIFGVLYFISGGAALITISDRYNW